jgi:hypothetical protein
MATAKKTTKKPVAKKAPSRSRAKTTVRRVSSSPAASATPSMKSFVPSRPSEPFFTFRVSQQTVYWLVLAVVVVALGLWVMNINDKVQRIYDEIDSTNSMIDSMPDTSTAKKAQ